MSPVSAPLAQRCICLWLLVFARLDETKAANLFSVHVPVTLEQRDEASQFYKVHNRDCKKCPAGSYVSKPCETPGSEGICYPCPNGTYNRHLTTLPKCLGCTICRDLDQVELKPCTQTSDTVCVCKEGTFCSPSLPCETCHTCTARCLDGEVMVHPCTHESDIQCVKSASTTSSTSPAGSNQRSIGRALVAVAVVVAIAAIIWICKYWNNRNTTTDSHHNQETSCSLKTLLWRRRTYTRGQQVEQGHRTNAQVDQASPSQAIPQSLVDSSEGEPLHPAVQPEEGGQVTERPKKLVPANGRDPLDALRQSFEVFVSLVPIPDWKRFVRALGLTDNEIYRAEFSERDVNEQQFQMLRTWLEKNGKKATMDTLMKTLSDINLLRIVGDIRAALLLQDLYHED